MFRRDDHNWHLPVQNQLMAHAAQAQLAETAQAAAWYRLLTSGEPLTTAFIDRLVRSVME